MDKLLQVFADNIGGVEAISKNSNFGKLLRRGGVSRGGEFLRIKALPRRRWQSTDYSELRELFNQAYGLPNRTIELWDIQLAAINEAVEVGGVFGPIPVGGGKALISILIATVLEAKRPLLLVPADLREQTKNKVLPLARKNFSVTDALVVKGYSELSVKSGADFLNTHKPDLIIADEAHRLKNKNSARTKRVSRYMRENPETTFIALSGTMTKQSLLDYAHIAKWCLKPRLCPVPVEYNTLREWADALDEGVDEPLRLPAGALIEFCEKDETPREGFGRRLTETAVVIATSENELGNSLVIKDFPLDTDLDLLEWIEQLENEWETPTGDVLAEAAAVWRASRQLWLGFFYFWEPAAPIDWLRKRSAWKKYVRETLKNNRRALDSELQVFNEAEKMEKPPAAFSEWIAIRDSFRPNTVARWLSDRPLNRIGEWLKQDLTQGIVWVEHVEVGNRLAELSGLPYFGAGKKASNDILDAKTACIASIAAHSEGKNLEYHNRNLVVSPPSSGKSWEQLLGRTHRFGQKADEVTVEVVVMGRLRDAFAKAINDARYIESTLKSKQKLNCCDIAIDGF